MLRKDKIRLMKKYRIKSCGDGTWASGFVEGLAAADTYKERSKLVKEEEINPPKK